MVSLPQPCADGTEKVKSKLNVSVEVIDCIGRMLGRSEKKKKKKESSTVGLVQRNKKTTSKDKYRVSLTNTPDTQLSRTSGRVSTSKGKDCYPFWNKSYKEEYKKLWLPRKTECVDLPLTSLSGCVTGMLSNSWFSTKTIKPKAKNSQKTSWPSCKFSVVDGTVNDDTTQRKHMVARKIRVYPKTHQKAILRRIEGATRKMYNEAIGIIKGQRLPFETEDAWKRCEEKRRKKSKNPDKYKESDKPWFNRLYLRNYLTPNESWFVQKHPYLKEIPKATREYAVFEAHRAMKGNFTNIRSKKIPKFNLGFRSKKESSRRGWTIEIAKGAIRGSTLFPINFKTFGNLEVPKSQRKWLHDKYKHGVKLQRDRYGDYYLIVVNEVPGTTMDDMRFDNQEARISSIDPGVRTRHTVYSNQGYAIEIAKGDITRLCRIARHISKSFSGRFDKKNNSKTRRRCHRKERKLRKRANNLTTELNNKTIHFLLTNNDIIVIPPFEVKNMVKRQTRCIGKETCKQMLSWAHYAFRKRLECKAKTLGKTVLVASEHYTSKTCGRCGALDMRLGSKKEFSCPKCGFKSHRDINAARNILLRSIRVHYGAPELADGPG